MLNRLPLELFENILFYLSSNDIEAVCVALDLQYNFFSSYFWKTLCLREDFPQFHSQQKWHECFEIGRNKRVGRYTKIDLPNGTLSHIYHKSLIMHLGNSYSVYIVEGGNKYKYVQKIKGNNLWFREEFIIAKRHNTTVIYAFNFDSNVYQHFQTIPELNLKLFGINKQYCGSYEQRPNWIALHIFNERYSYQCIKLPGDVKLVLPIDSLLHCEEIVIPVLSVDGVYKIKVYNIKSNRWTLDIFCHTCTGVTNSPNVWVGSNFIGMCDVSFRSRGVYFGPIKVWDKQGTLILTKDVQPCSWFYLRCFFEDDFVILTTSSNQLTVFNNRGEEIVVAAFDIHFHDISLSIGHLLFILQPMSKDFQSISFLVVDWTSLKTLYEINFQHNGLPKIVSNDCFVCTDYKTEKSVLFSFV